MFFCYASSLAAADFVAGEVLVGLCPDFRQSLSAEGGFANCAIGTRFDHLRSACGTRLLHLRDSSRSTAAILEALSNDSRIAFAEPNYIRRRQLREAPNDPRYAEQWALRNSGQSVGGVAGVPGADIAWGEARRLARRDDEAVVIAIIDSGMDVMHADLRNRLWRNPGEIPGNNRDDDGNGFVDDLIGWDFAFGDNDPSDLDALDSAIDHGTHVAGIAAAESENAQGIAGISKARLMILKADSGDGLTVSAVIAAMDYVAQMVARGVPVVVINGSYGGPSFSQSEKNAMDALADLGVIFTAAAGNEAVDNDTVASYPANYPSPNVISVAATDSRETLADFSNFGSSSVDLAAPGDRILSTLVASYTASVAVGDVSYSSEFMEFSGLAEGLTRPYIDCGLGGSPADFPAEVVGNIALIERGSFYFSEKVRNAMNAGAVGAVIYNNDSTMPDSTFSGTLRYPDGWIPSVALSRNAGLALQPFACTGSSLTLSVQMLETGAYGLLSGTSMAAPMVAGAIAELARHFPEDSMTERTQRLYNALDAQSALSGRVATSGRLNLGAAMDSDGDTVPDWFELALGGLNQVNALSDFDGDGTADLWEFRAGTDPRDAGSAFRLSVRPSASDAGVLKLQWPSSQGRVYEVFAADALSAPFELYAGELEADAWAGELSVPIESTGDRFFQLRLLWPD